MSTQPFASTPAFELFRRGLVTQTIQRFHGINAFLAAPLVGPEYALDCLNVIVNQAGGLSKFRLPVNVMGSAALTLFHVQIGSPNIASFWELQQPTIGRLVLVNYVDGSIVVWGSNFQNITILTPVHDATNLGQWDWVAANNILFGTNGLKMTLYAGGSTTALRNWGLLVMNNAPGVVAVAGSLSPTVGYQYSTAWMDSLTGHVGNISPISASTGPQTSKQFQVTVNQTNQGTADTWVLFRSLDGGSDQFRLAQININNGAIVTFSNSASVVGVSGSAPFITVSDNSPDTGLDLTTRGPQVNNPPLQGTLLAVGQSRIFVAGITGNPQDIIYSGYEQIFLGRPEESFPPFNRLRLSIGADAVAGMGVIQAGLVAFSNTGKMYMLRGAVEDVTTAQPVNFSAYLEELPWTLGCFSHFTVRATPYGLIWLAGDKTVQLFNGHSKPTDISQAIYPLLQQITPGTESAAVAAYFNWLERDWYVLNVAVNGSLTPNKMFWFSLDPVTENIEIFISNIASPWIDTITTTVFQREFLITDGGFNIQNLPVAADTVNGMTQNVNIIPATNGQLNAYWRGGYFGSDQPQRSKMWRWQTLIADPMPQVFMSTVRLINDSDTTFQTPDILGPNQYSDATQGISRRAKRLSVEINFPLQDFSANVLELQVAQISTSDRKG